MFCEKNRMNYICQIDHRFLTTRNEYNSAWFVLNVLSKYWVISYFCNYSLRLGLYCKVFTYLHRHLYTLVTRSACTDIRTYINDLTYALKCIQKRDNAINRMISDCDIKNKCTRKIKNNRLVSFLDRYLFFL